MHKTQLNGGLESFCKIYHGKKFSQKLFKRKNIIGDTLWLNFQYCKNLLVELPLQKSIKIDHFCIVKKFLNDY